MACVLSCICDVDRSLEVLIKFSRRKMGLHSLRAEGLAYLIGRLIIRPYAPFLRHVRHLLSMKGFGGMIHIWLWPGFQTQWRACIITRRFTMGSFVSSFTNFVLQFDTSPTIINNIVGYQCAARSGGRGGRRHPRDHSPWHCRTHTRAHSLTLSFTHARALS